MLKKDNQYLKLCLFEMVQSKLVSPDLLNSSKVKALSSSGIDNVATRLYWIIKSFLTFLANSFTKLLWT